VTETAGVDRLTALHLAIDLVRRGGTISVSGVYGGVADPLPMLTMFDKQITLRMGQANVKRWIDDILPLSHIQQCPQEMFNGMTTRSPALMCVTSLPTASTMPIGSWPRMSPSSMYGPRTS